ncbi:hypothetical protein KPH14_003474 [Odynerus spinipes]|uniref:Uncharacterized protein n=1 Tax=Odynerus spinipes TaxID=1348599 RepID=A0AAD9VK10_9HYME|nr:hypothetical protein KPH14_003474 [Odynerus spinipes]
MEIVDDYSNFWNSRKIGTSLPKTPRFIVPRRCFDGRISRHELITRQFIADVYGGQVDWEEGEWEKEKWEMAEEHHRVKLHCIDNDIPEVNARTKIDTAFRCTDRVLTRS